MVPASFAEALTSTPVAITLVAVALLVMALTVAAGIVHLWRDRH